MAAHAHAWQGHDVLGHVSGRPGGDSAERAEVQLRVAAAVYSSKKPIKLPAGSMLRVVAHYDNSANNKFNPAPDQELPWGGQSWHEMYFPYFDLAVSKEVEQIRGDKHGLRKPGADGVPVRAVQRTGNRLRRSSLRKGRTPGVRPFFFASFKLTSERLD